MKIIGIIAEFNPFHNGHKLLIDYALNEMGADYIVIVMSGHFVQRGEPAIFDKWSRSKMCLYAGAHIVIELPVIFSTASAEFFSQAAVTLLDSLNCITDIVFGAECDDLSVLKSYASLFADEPKPFKDLLRLQLSKGISFPVARANAADKFLKMSSPEVLYSPNNILAIEYLKALIKINSNIAAHVFLRKYAHYHSTDVVSTIASATALRLAIKNNKLFKLENTVPIETLGIISSLIEKGTGPCYFDSMSDLLHYKLRTSTVADISSMLDVTEGLEHRILYHSKNNYMISDLVNAIKTKRYTFTKIQRALLHIILNISDQLFLENRDNPKYIRILGFKKNSDIIKIITNNPKLPVIINPAKDMKKLNTNAKELLKIDFCATDVFTISFCNKQYSNTMLDLVTPVVTI